MNQSNHPQQRCNYPSASRLTPIRRWKEPDWTGTPPTATEALESKKWRMRFAIFACLCAFALLCGALAGWIH